MCANERLVNMGFTEKKWKPGIHMCLIYNDESERRRVVGKFLEAGLLSGEKVDYFYDARSCEEVKAWLGDIGVKVHGESERQQIRVSAAKEIYCPEGIFSPEKMISLLKAHYTKTLAEGYPGARLTGEMEWALKGIPGSEQLVRYEDMVNDALKTHPITGMCQYDAKRFDGETLFKILKVHPYMVANGQIVQNPYFAGSYELNQNG
ncbi:hypothetical protein EPN96_03385 [bacterium]|nr:MAG: hypothetical protein EPN96_03385 [bacterium]